MEKRLLLFGPYCLDTSERLLTRAGKHIPLSPKIFDTLLVLAENSGHIMEKDALLQCIWPDSFVEENSLTQCVFQIRRILADGDPGAQYIETIPRRGYRFAVPVTETWGSAPEVMPGPEPPDLPAPAENAVPPAVPSTHSGAWSWSATAGAALVTVRPLWIKAAAALIVVVAGLGAFGAWRLVRQSQSAVASNLPFDAMRISRVTRTGRTHLQAISPDGKYIAHVVEDASRQSLWIRQAAANSNMQIVPPVAGDYRGVAFSRDSSHVYYALYASRPNQIGVLYQIPALGGVPRKIVEDIDSGIALSPDGKQLAFVRNYPMTQESALITVNADGGGERRLAVRKRPNRFSFDGMSWSPDGRHIAIAVGSKVGEQSYMSVVGVRVADGAEIPAGTQRWNYAGQVAWMRDGAGLVAVAWHPDYTVFADQLWHINWPDGRTRRITNDLDGYSGISIADDASAMTTIQTTRLASIQVIPHDKSGHDV
ncbi:MAG: winged helix-turn-helix domain-containing protein [Blastocatellia bacterium]